MRAFLLEWQAAVGDSVKPSTGQNYADYIRAYVDPIIGDRRLQDITVPVLNLFYRRLLIEGRVKTDRNSAMFAYWSEHRAERDGLGPTPAQLVTACGVSIHAARAAAPASTGSRPRATAHLAHPTEAVDGRRADSMATTRALRPVRRDVAARRDHGTPRSWSLATRSSPTASPTPGSG